MAADLKPKLPVTNREVIDGARLKNLADLPACGKVSRRVWHHVVGQVGHAGQVVQVGRGQVLGVHHHRDVEVLARDAHGLGAVLQSAATTLDQITLD